MRTLTLPMPCLSSTIHTTTNDTCRIRFFTSSSSSSIFNKSQFHKRFHFVTPCSSLKQTKKQRSKINTTVPPPSGLKRLFSSKGEEDDEKNESEVAESDSEDDGFALKGTILAGVLLVAVVGGFGAVGYFYRDPINSFLNQLSLFIEGISFLNFNFNTFLLLFYF